jgi:hypothetical protein
MEATSLGADFLMAFPTERDVNYTVERTDRLERGATWTFWESFVGNGIEHVIRRPLGWQEFFRVRPFP